MAEKLFNSMASVATQLLCQDNATIA